VDASAAVSSSTRAVVILWAYHSLIVLENLEFNLVEWKAVALCEADHGENAPRREGGPELQTYKAAVESN
jgi:hypothetical protein